MWGNPVAGAGSNLLHLAISEELNDVDIFQLLGSPAYPVVAVVSILDTSAIKTITTGDMFPGSSVRFTHEGYFLGAGADGGRGAVYVEAGGGEPAVVILATAGGVGGSALTMLCEVTLDVREGNIWGGGGGGGGAGTPSILGVAGGGGGGGVSGGQGGVINGGDATSGINAILGAGGVSGSTGGDGGNWGGSGTSGETVGIANYELGGAGGNGGLAIETNGFPLIFLGKDEAQLRTEGRLIGTIL